MKALLEDHLTNHVVCAKDEHYSVGAAETAVNNLRHSARAMMLHGNVPKRFWHFAIAHATYLHNVISPSRADKSRQNDLRITLRQEGRFNASSSVRMLRNNIQKSSNSARSKLRSTFRPRHFHWHSNSQKRFGLLHQ